MPLTFANKVTIARILVVPFFIATLLYYSKANDSFRYIALGLFLFAVISDAIDGYIARTRHQKTKAGAILDPLADKLLLISAFLCLTFQGHLFQKIQFPLWLVVAVISRDVILLLGAMLIQMLQGNLSITPTKWGKAATVFQMLSVIGMLLQFDVTISIGIWYSTVFLTVISGLDYIRQGIKILNEPSHFPRP